MTVVLLARNELHADELIAALIRDCAEGKSDREPEALRLAKLGGSTNQVLQNDLSRQGTLYANCGRGNVGPQTAIGEPD